MYENSLQLIHTQLVHNARYFAQFYTFFCRYTDMQILNGGKVFNQNFSPGSHRIFLLRFGSVINNIPGHIEKEEKSLIEMLCTLYKSTMYQMKIMFKNQCIIRLATSRCQYLSCFKDSAEDHYALILFHENTAHTGTHVTSIYFQ